MTATRTDAGNGRRRRLRVAHLCGCDLDEDMWDRVVGFWRLNAEQPDAAFQWAADRVRKAVCQRRVELHLLLDGPRLLKVTAVSVGAST